MCTPLPTQSTQKESHTLIKMHACRVSLYLYLIILLLYGMSSIANAQVTVGQWDRFEASLTNPTVYTDAYNDVTLDVTYTKPDGSSVNFWGFYDGENTWRIRFMPDQLGEWAYQATFSDGSPGSSGTFTCVASSIPGMFSKDETNPRWFGFKGGKHTLVRSFHGGPPLLAYNFSDTDRKSFLDWVNGQGYNMLSVNDFYDAVYDIPDLWPLSARAYQQIEKVLNELAARQIIFYSFGGLFPRDEAIPSNEEEEILLVKYYLARLAPYWNILLNASGSEANYDNYITSSKVNRVGAEIQIRDPFKHPVGNHNKDGDDPYRYQSWAGYATLQVEITDLYALNTYLLKNHTGTKPVYAQENLWPGNTLQPSGQFDATTIRKHAWVHMLSATSLNYGDMNGRNHSGFSGSLNLADKVQARHDIVDKVWDFMETVPFFKMSPDQNAVNNGFCLAEAGQQYLVYLPVRGSVSIAVEPGKTYAVKWINGQNPLQDQRSGGTTSTGQNLASPTDGDDWLVYLTVDNSPQSCTATGSILREYWANVRGGAVSDIPVNTVPTSSTQLTSFETPSTIGDNYAQRIRGYICPPVTGNYIFYLASDDQGELWLSTNDNPASKQKIAYITSHAGSKQWTKFPTQKSIEIALEKGKKYYIEALHKEAVYGDNLAVGWTLPGSTSIQVIPGAVLSPVLPEPVACTATGSILREYWANVRGGAVSDIPVNTVPTSSTQLTSFETPSTIGDNYAQRIRGYICPPVTGNYIFYLASDDQGELWLSTNDNPASKQKIAYITSHAGSKQWTKFPTQKSIEIALEKGKKYYIEALHKEAVYGDNLAVGWTLPSSTSIQVIPGSVLSPFVPSPARLAGYYESAQNQFIVFPNPFSDKLSIATQRQQGKVRISLTDIVGKTYFSHEYQLAGQAELTIDFSALSLKPGMHLLKLQSEEGKIHVLKLIKK
ncbi:PA14 domain-containing protein [Rhodocytophaga aerolata]|uniref:PA14 domain-containing protein n=1 Tax=Rhodocytophaga aerolata TaxID=455078 RepID=A0ABT8R5E0_9BACT|nr:PA14 domain-containing protein [Rhodocytophaga aerolata]MDO1446498.1 PA14 domain-containing protein [Rhodocytophaga aerolata]